MLRPSHIGRGVQVGLLSGARGRGSCAGLVGRVRVRGARVCRARVCRARVGEVRLSGVRVGGAGVGGPGCRRSVRLLPPPADSRRKPLASAYRVGSRMPPPGSRHRPRPSDPPIGPAFARRPGFRGSRWPLRVCPVAAHRPHSRAWPGFRASRRLPHAAPAAASPPAFGSRPLAQPSCAAPLCRLPCWSVAGALAAPPRPIPSAVGFPGRSGIAENLAVLGTAFR
jgi:hypothetical protein